MNISTKNTNDFKKCKYNNLKNTNNTPDSNFYNIKIDLVIDKFKSGYPYTNNSETTYNNKATSCTYSTTDKTYINLDDPTITRITTNNNTIYYSKSSGMYYIKTNKT